MLLGLFQGGCRVYLPRAKPVQKLLEKMCRTSRVFQVTILALAQLCLEVQLL